MTPQTRIRPEGTSAALPPAERTPILEIIDLATSFFLDEGEVRAVDGVSLRLDPGTTLGIVGESGCGKSVLARSILQIVPGNARVVRGSVVYRHGDQTVDLARLDRRGSEIRSIRGRSIAMIFQEPMAAFAPVYTVGRQIVEAIRVHSATPKRQARGQAVDLLARVGIPNPDRAADRYPFELSGGMLQRAMIAMALSCDPAILIADEPTTALDVTIQAQILALLRSIQAETGMSIIIISHNMGVIAEMADHVAVMYLGRVVEEAPLWELFDRPQHPYTQGLLRAIPMVSAEPSARLESITGNVPSPFLVPSGCRFHPRCPAFIEGTCDASYPALFDVSANHRAACFLVEGDDAGG